MILHTRNDLNVLNYKPMKNRSDDGVRLALLSFLSDSSGVSERTDELSTEELSTEARSTSSLSNCGAGKLKVCWLKFTEIYGREAEELLFPNICCFNLEATPSTR